MKTNDPVPLVRRFSPVAASPSDSDEKQIQELFEFRSPATWEDLDKKYRSVVLAEAGAGKTFEMLARAQHVEQQGRPAFFSRIEDIGDDFQYSFDVGSAEGFEQWLRSQDDAWFYLDSVDEARLENPRTFEKAIRRFSREIRNAQHRAHVCISSRPYAWRARSDRDLVKRHLPLPKQRSERRGEDPKTTDISGSEDGLEVFVLWPLDERDIRQFAEHRSIPEVDRLIDDLERRNLIDLAERPFDLEAILDKWACDGALGSKSELLHHNVKMRLKDSHNPDRAHRQSLNLAQALAGARGLAAAVVLTGERDIQVPDGTHARGGIDAEAVLFEWDPRHVHALLERGIPERVQHVRRLIEHVGAVPARDKRALAVPRLQGLQVEVQLAHALRSRSFGRGRIVRAKLWAAGAAGQQECSQPFAKRGRSCSCRWQPMHANNETVARKHTGMMRSFHATGTLWTNIDCIIETPVFVDSNLTRMVHPDR